MSSTDQTVRLLAALIIVIAYFTNTISQTTAIILAFVAAIFIATGFIGFCPLYFAFGITSRKREKQN